MLTILVIDDNDSIRRGLSLVLEAAGFRAISAGDGVEALEVCQSMTPDLILLDLSMPDMDGLTLLELLWEQPGWSSIPVVIYSAVDDPSIRRRIQRLGADFVLKGTSTWEELVGLIRQRLMQMSAVAMPQQTSGHYAGFG